MTIEGTELGLRERKRIATKRAIQLAALQRVAEKGLERLTIDEIGRIADISPRTFFNYFPTKEAALIGETPGLPPQESVDRFVNAGPEQGIFRGLAELLTTSVEATAEDHELTQLRRSVLKQHPQLLGMRIATMKQFEDELFGIVVRRLQKDGGVPATEALTTRARLVTLVAFATMRHAWSCWADARGASDLSRRLQSSFDELETLLASSAPN